MHLTCIYSIHFFGDELASAPRLRSRHEADKPERQYEVFEISTWLFLRRLEQRIRIVHGASTTVLDAGAAGLSKLARRMGIRGTPAQTEAEALLEAYADVTEQVRETYLEVLGVAEE